MICEQCRSANDDDARFCTSCGSTLGVAGAASSERPGWNWRYLLLLVPVLAFAAAVGYYKFYLPQGVAAVVNGEEIALADVDRLVLDTTNGRDVPEEMRSRMRFAVLNRMITERIAWQEARRAGMTVSEEELKAAVEGRRAASGLNESSFAAQVRERYGSEAALRRNIEQQLLISKYIDARVVAGAADAATVSARMDEWVRTITAKADIRIALAEELPAGGSGCGCCNGPAGGPGQAKVPTRMSAAGDQKLTPQAQDAQKAALAYWKARNGDGPVDTKLQDFGCHIQVDIVQNDKTVRSLRYQNGAITEM